MKNKLKHMICLGLFAALLTSLAAQPDTLTKTGRPFEDPKITDDNTKVLIDTTKETEQFVDSLLEGNKKGKKVKHPDQPMKAPMKKDKLMPADKTQIKKE